MMARMRRPRMLDGAKEGHTTVWNGTMSPSEAWHLPLHQHLGSQQNQGCSRYETLARRWQTFTETHSRTPL